MARAPGAIRIFLTVQLIRSDIQLKNKSSNILPTLNVGNSVPDVFSF